MSDVFFGEKVVRKTRKDHQCASCNTTIRAGSPAYYCSSVQDGEFFAWYAHPDCRSAESHWNSLRGTYGEDYCWLWEMLDEGYNEDEHWLAAEHPVAAGRMLISIEGCERVRSNYWAWAP